MSNWWADKLGAPQQPRQAAPVQPPVQYAAPQPAQYAPSQQNYPPTQQMTPQASRCPGCGSGNYGGASGYKPRCYDCGYPVQQSGSGLGRGIVSQGGTAAGPATPAKQVATGGFNGTTPVIGPDGNFK